MLINLVDDNKAYHIVGLFGKTYGPTYLTKNFWRRSDVQQY
jgi:hypothetical protein